MTVLQEILDWSRDRPTWQRDALRRLLLQGQLSADDIGALADICKAAHGLAAQQEATPLARTHVPTKSNAAEAVSLVSIFHHRGVNALAEGQSLRFAPNLTVVYGDNAAGKTGYIRILKSACRARGQEEILGNVVSGTAPLSPVVAIKYTIGTKQDTQEWAGDGQDEFISRVSVFDTHCAAVYLTEKTDVAFRPFGLDLFDKLVKACKAVRAQLEREQRALASNALTAVRAEVPHGTAAATLLGNITSLTNVDAVKKLSRLSVEEETRMALVEESLLDLQAKDPDKLVRELTLRAGRVQTLSRHIKEVEAALSADAVAAVFDIREEGRRKSAEAKRLRDATFPSGLLPGTGSESWNTLWEAARQFSQESSYPGQAFPVVENGAHCVLCQQNLDGTARHRFRRFEEFVTSTTERELRRARDGFLQRRRTFTDLKVTTGFIEEVLEEIRIDDDAVSAKIAGALAVAEGRRKTVDLALTEDRDVPIDCPVLQSVASDADALVDQIVQRVSTLRASDVHATRQRIAAETEELRARKVLGRYEKVVLDEIERKRKYAAYGLCIEGHEDPGNHPKEHHGDAECRHAETQAEFWR